jgi:hypothetical protein
MHARLISTRELQKIIPFSLLAGMKKLREPPRGHHRARSGCPSAVKVSIWTKAVEDELLRICSMSPWLKFGRR